MSEMSEMSLRELKINKARELYSWGESVLFAVLVVVIIFSTVFRTASVSGSSMVPTLHDKELLIISNLFFKPKTGDVVVLDSVVTALDEALVKRVIATGGQTVDIDFNTGDVIVDGKLLNEKYIAEPTNETGDQTYPLTVPNGMIFVMGDNRNHSTDSRFKIVGFIDNRYILGHVLFRMWPVSKFGAVQ